MKYGEQFYLVRKKTIDNGIVEYEEPMAITLRPFHISIMPRDVVRGNYSVQEFGMQVNYDWVGVAYKSHFKNMFHEGDLLYLDGLVPPNNSENYEDANAIITNVLDNNLTYRILIKSRIMKENY